ncbi:MAG: tape measure protein [Rhodobacteraceae bacterium]|nr:tape measure protein [Paracoccaceae bacterium]
MPGDLDLAVRVRADLTNAVRQLDRLERELKQTGAAGRTAGRGGREAAAGTDRASRSADRAARNFNRLGDAAERSGRGLGILRGALAGVGAALVVREIIQAARAVTETGLAFERLEQRFTFATGSIRGGVEAFRFVQAEAERLGISFAAAGDGFSSLAAAAKGTALEGEAAREIFLALSEASTVLRLTQDQARGAFRAVEQIISKGTLSAEELRQQLGERLPGAFQIAARSLGVTTEELNKMLERGEVLSEEFLPRFAAELRRTFAGDVPEAARSSAAEFARLGNAIERLQDSIARSGLLEFLADVSSALADVVDRATAFVDSLGGGGDAGGIEARTAALARTRERLETEENGLAEAQRRLEEASTRSLNFRSAAQRASLALLREEVRTRAEATAQLRESYAAQESFLRRQAALRTRPAEPAAAVPAVTPEVDREALDKALEEIARFRDRVHDQFRRDSAGPGGLLRLDFERDLESLRRFNAAALEAAAGNAEETARINEAAAAAELALRAKLARDRDRLIDKEEERLRTAAERRAGEAERAARREADVRARVLAEIGRRQDALGLITPYEDAVRAAETWRAEVLRDVNAVAGGHEELAGLLEQINRIYMEMIAQAEEARRANETLAGAIAAGARDYAGAAADSLGEVRSAAERAFGGLEDALTRFVTTGKLDFKDFANSVIADIARIAIRQQVIAPLAEAFGGAFGGGGFFGLFHGGGIAGSPGGRERLLPAAAFAGAPRLHAGGIAGGLRADEVPTILRRGEGVFTPEQMAALSGPAAGPVSVEVVNRGTPQEAVSADARIDARGMIIEIVTDDIRSGGRIGRTLQDTIPGMRL